MLRSHRPIGTEAPDLEGVAREYAGILRAYRCGSVWDHKYAGAWIGLKGVADPYARRALNRLPAALGVSRLPGFEEARWLRAASPSDDR